MAGKLRRVKFIQSRSLIKLPQTPWNEAGGLPLTQPLPERRRSNNIGEHQRQQTGSMFAAKLLDLRTVLQCQFEVHREQEF